MFIFDQCEFKSLSAGKVYQMGNFYKKIRVEKNLLMDGDMPVGGKWTFDEENRKKIPSREKIPEIPTFKKTKYHQKISSFVAENFTDHPGNIDKCWLPTTLWTKKFFIEFLAKRFEKFGDYEDAIDTRGHLLFHSGISALLNVGLLLPKDV